MSVLYCQKHGDEYDQTLHHRSMESFEGESVIAIHHQLISGPWLCDKCNTQLEEGDPAYIFSFLTVDMTDHFYEYSFDIERDYFEFEVDDVKLYGAEWPD